MLYHRTVARLQPMHQLLLAQYARRLFKATTARQMRAVALYVGVLVPYAGQHFIYLLNLRITTLHYLLIASYNHVLFNRNMLFGN